MNSSPNITTHSAQTRHDAAALTISSAAFRARIYTMRSAPGQLNDDGGTRHSVQR